MGGRRIATGVRKKLSVGELRILVAQSAGKAWAKVLQNPDFIKWSFAATGLTLPTDGSLDHKLDIQNSQRGVPEGMIIQ